MVKNRSSFQRLRIPILIFISIVAWAKYHSKYVIVRGNLILPNSFMGIYFTHSHGDGTIVLVRRGTAVGAFQLIKQGYRSVSEFETYETVAYRYMYREDGGTLLDSKDSAVHSGEVLWDAAIKPSISFGGFNVKWSISSFGRGYLYFDRNPNEAVHARDQRFCISELEKFEVIEMSEQQCQFRGSNSTNSLN